MLSSTPTLLSAAVTFGGEEYQNRGQDEQDGAHILVLWQRCGARNGGYGDRLMSLFFLANTTTAKVSRKERMHNPYQSRAEVVQAFLVMLERHLKFGARPATLCIKGLEFFMWRSGCVSENWYRRHIITRSTEESSIKGAEIELEYGSTEVER
ncbi:hypothetical protein V500_04777 [Pseudogymnoascus sp. VKM F-4518 (FW-2643)]|nr:hypothetical protein V500_04777 [Pseudogymnoascus sp. VKM F-4518 (FW-2643)]